MGDCCSTTRSSLSLSRSSNTNFEEIAKEQIKLNQYEEAISNFQRALDLYRAELGEDNMIVAGVYLKLADVFKALERKAECLDYLKRSLEITAKIFGEFHKNVEGLCDIIFNICLLNDDKVEACQFLERLLNIKQTLKGSFHDEVASVNLQLGNLYEDLGKYDQAVYHLGRYTQIRKILHGEACESIATSYQIMGQIFLEKLGDISEGMNYLEKSLKLFIELHGELDWQVAILNLKLGESRVRRGDITSGRRNLESALNIGNKVYWDQYMVKLQFFSKVYFFLGLLNEKDQNFERSRLFFKQSLENDYQLACNTYGKNNYLTAYFHTCLGNVCLEMNEFAESMYHYQTSLEVLEFLNEDENEIANAQLNIGGAYMLQSSYLEAGLYYSKAFCSCQIKYRNSHHETKADIYYRLGLLNQLKGHDREALNYLTKALDMYIETCGEYNYQTISCRFSIGIQHKNNQKYELAIRQLEKAYSMKIEHLNHTINKFKKLDILFPDVYMQERDKCDLKDKILGENVVLNIENKILEELRNTYEEVGKDPEEISSLLNKLRISKSSFASNHSLVPDTI